MSLMVVALWFGLPNTREIVIDRYLRLDARSQPRASSDPRQTADVFGNLRSRRLS